MSRRGCHRLHLFIALLTFAGAARGQENAPMIVDLSKLPPNLESDFTTWRTGEGEAA